MLIGAEFQTASSAETSLLIMQLIYNFQHQSETNRISNVKLLAILDTYNLNYFVHSRMDMGEQVG